MTLTREQILQADDLKRVKVDVPEWGGEVYISVLSAAARDAIEADWAASDGKVEHLRSRVVARTLTDGAGNRLFGDEDIPEVAKKNSAAIDRLFSEAMKINGMSAGSVEDAEKN